MAFTHGKNTFISINSGASDLSAYTNNVEFVYKVDDHDVTTFGQTGHVWQGGLKDGTLTLTGVYDNSTAGPHDVLIPLLGTVCSMSYRSEGTGSGLPQITSNVLVSSYQETAPVADMVTWTCDLMLSGTLTSTNQ